MPAKTLLPECKASSEAAISATHRHRSRAQRAPGPRKTSEWSKKTPGTIATRSVEECEVRLPQAVALVGVLRLSQATEAHPQRGGPYPL